MRNSCKLLLSRDVARRELVRYMVPLPAAEARRDRLSGKMAHLYNDSLAHEFAIQTGSELHPARSLSSVLLLLHKEE
ncbi:MAG TPA: hypothetical protein VEU97_06745 [Ktedonobacteraceae bacterium]|nr:hypothetical protein [Ktedonobacteraceae bacterium]